MNYRVGIGYDVHRLVEERQLILGGVHIPYKKGLLGHSDADVLVHSIMDALLGALSLGDIGQHFPPDDNSYKNIDSLVLLKKVKQLIKSKNYQIGNIDTIIIAEKPKMMPFIQNMRDRIAKCININIDQISIKATTTEGCGFIGSEEAIASKSIVILEKLKN